MRDADLRPATQTASVFDTRSRDDIVFVSSGALTNQGQCANVGDTSRVGLELNASGTLAPAFHWRSGDTWLRATFDSPLTLSSPNHPGALDGEIAVARAATTPGVPRHGFEAAASFTAERTSLAAHLGCTSSTYLRGDEANLLPPTDGAASVNLSGGYAVHERVRIVARVTNVFGARYASFGVLGDPTTVLGGPYWDPRLSAQGRRARHGSGWSGRCADRQPVNSSIRSREAKMRWPARGAESRPLSLDARIGQGLSSTRRVS